MRGSDTLMGVTVRREVFCPRRAEKVIEDGHPEYNEDRTEP